MAKKTILASKSRFAPQVFEGKWQKAWREKGIFTAQDASEKQKKYILVEFPYPSGDLHMGHWYAFVPADVYSRYKRMQGYNVLFPIGFDAFGLPAENAAIQREIHPRDWTYGNIEKMLGQFESMGPSFDWGRIIVSCDPEYYRWNQWFFLKLLEAGLAYRDEVYANWCPKCQTVLANEQVENGCCWRHADTEVVQKKIPQWLFKITAYADKLLWSFDSAQDKTKVDWPKSLIEGQNKWIGKSEGVEIEFQMPNAKLQIRIFTTRSDTVFGATFLVLSPEHPLTASLSNLKKGEIQKYIESSSKKSELERKEMKEKPGVFTGMYAINPFTKKKISIWIADYVLASYGTGAIMGVPAHDRRDFEFAKKYGLEVVEVIEPETRQESSGAYEGEGKLVNSGEFTGLSSQEAREKITKYIEKNRLGERKVQYHLHDWTVSRQRYWGTPIPIIHCQKCGAVPVPEEGLPVELPYKVDYTPKGEAPLATAPEFVNVKCPRCDGPAKRDTDTMDTFVDSSWYFFRFASPHYNKGFADPELVKKWLPVDIYFGGAEHTLGHTMYARFFTKFLHDKGLIAFDEFAQKRVHHGVILGPDGQKMSKSRGNVVNPDTEVKKYGADTVRLYLCFMGPHEAGGLWNPEGVMGAYRFLRRVWELVNEDKNVILKEEKDSKEVLRAMHKAIKRVTEDIEALKFNTAISSLMIYVNALQEKVKSEKRKAKGKIRCAEWDEALRTLLLLLAPFAPHMAEELWQHLRVSQVSRVPRGEKARDTLGTRGTFKSIHLQPWPKFDPELVKEEMVEIPVQVNGRFRTTVLVDGSEAGSQEAVEAKARQAEGVRKHLEGKTVTKTIFIPSRLINFVV